MIVRAIDGSGDWFFGKSASNYLQKDAAISQRIRTRILSILGDCFFALQDGVDWPNLLDVGKQSEMLLAVKTTILQTEGVVSVQSVDGSFSGLSRNFLLTYGIQTIFSPAFQGIVNVVIPSEG